MSLTRLAVYRPRVILMLLAIVSLAGLVSVRQLDQDVLPQVNLSVVTVGVPYPGAGSTESRSRSRAPSKTRSPASPTSRDDLHLTARRRLDHHPLS